MPDRAILAAILIAALAVPVTLVASGETVPSGAKPYGAYLASTARDGLPAQSPVPVADPGQLPPAPPAWPAELTIGHFDSPGAAQATAGRGMRVRYQYLAGGVNTGNGWATWNPGGSFVSNYAAESVDAGVVPVFSYYMVRQSLPGANQGEAEGVRANLGTEATTRALFDDLELLFRRAHGSGAPLSVLHFEPDLWGFIQQESRDDNAATFPVPVASSGHPDLADLPDTAAGLAQAVIRLRDRYAPETLVAYHLSTWGTGTDPLHADPSPAELDRLAASSAAFYTSLGARFDLAFAEMSDRDAAFKDKIYGDGGASWWDEGDFARHAGYLARFTASTGLRTVLWQIPQGNTVMRAMDNTWAHFQDNKVEWLLGDPGLTRLREYVAAGVIALLFGRGADGATCACDAAGDGVTNPQPINGNVRDSLSADDDGGYFAERLQYFTRQPAIVLP